MCGSRLSSCCVLASTLCLWTGPGSYGSCPADQAATLLPGVVPQELLWEASIASGETVPLAQVDTEWEEIDAGQSREYDCWYLHWGFSGSFRRQCGVEGTTSAAGEVATIPKADIYGCLRTGCVWHRYILEPARGPYSVSEGAEIAVDGASTSRWSSLVLASSGAFYAAPMSAKSVLQIDAAGGIARTLAGPDLGPSSTKYSAIVLGPDGVVFAVPYSAPKVLRIDPGTATVTAIGGNFEENYKWSHGVLAHDGRIYTIPSFASTVLRIDPASGSTTELSGDKDAGGVMKWLHGVVAPNGIIFGIPSNSRSVLRIDPKLGLVSSFGDFGAQARKWAHGLLGSDGQIYGVPSSATAVLRIDPIGSVAYATLGQGLPEDDYKWSMGVTASDGNIYCVPSSSQQVLRINPSAATVDLFGSLSADRFKWQHGILAPDGQIYAIPSSASRVLCIDPAAGTVKEVGPDLGPNSKKYDAAALAPSGKIYAAPSSASRVLQIGADADVCTSAPAGLHVKCTLGVLCEVILTSLPSRRSALGNSNLLWVSTATGQCMAKEFLSIRGFVNPQGTSSDLGNGSRRFTIGTATWGAATFMHQLCWSPSSASQEIITLGSFTLNGPEQISVDCIIGIPCTVRISGNGLSSGSSLLLTSIAVPCGSEAPAKIEGFTNPHSVNSTQNQNNDVIAHDLGLSQSGPVGVFRLCWAQTYADMLESGAGFLVQLGELTMTGPVLEPQGSPIECWVGAPCVLSLAGTSLSDTNRISIREDCHTGGFLVNVKGLVSEAVPSSNGQTYALGTPTEGSGRLLALCWHNSASSPGVLYRQFQVYGTMGAGIAVKCALGQPCNFMIRDDVFYGATTMLSMQNRVQLFAGKTSACNGQSADLWSGAANPVSPVDNTSVYVLGEPTAATFASSQAAIGDYSLCFSRDGKEFAMHIGTLRVDDVQCTVPDAASSAAPPCISLDQNQQLVSVLGHAESCAPRCQQGYSSSVAALKCQYGRVEPPEYECNKKCSVVPVVTNGEDHSHCKDLLNADRCVVRCPFGHVKSGDLECDKGVWKHLATLPLKLLFDVPRCYRSCDAQAVGCVVEGAGRVEHGQVCRTSCEAGYSPSVPEVRCFDGTAEPRTFECFQQCALPPDIPHSTGLEFCRDWESSDSCALRCESGYLPSGDPTCVNGAWTSEQCLAPCTAPSVANASVMPCDGSLLVQHGSHCRPMCLEDFTPVVSVGGAMMVSGTFGPHLNCSNGQLTPASFSCMASCMEPPKVEYTDALMLKSCIGTRHGSICHASCLPGYRKYGDLKCVNGTFTEAVCLKECETPPVIEHARINYACEHKAPDAVCETFCFEGWLATGSAVCKDGAWSPVQCVRSCSAPDVLEKSFAPSCEEGSKIESGGICTPLCLPGYTPSSPRLVCTNGQLRPSSFKCQRGCGIPNKIPNAFDVSDCARKQVDEMCDFKCFEGFLPDGRLHCDFDGWRQLRGKTLIGKDLLMLRRGRLLGKIQSSRNFKIHFEINLMAPAGLDYQNLLHFSARGGNCCELGDRQPAVFLAPSLEGSSGRELHVFLDQGTGCFLRDLIPIGTRTLVVISFVEKVLQVSIDGKICCTTLYSADLNPQMGVHAYGSSPWHEPADAELRHVVYEEVLLNNTFPKCQPVICQDALPLAQGALEDQSSVGTGCKGAAFNTSCREVLCPEGTELAGHFVCGSQGQWLHAQGVTVSCRSVECPEMLPAVSQMMAVNSRCVDRKFGDTCAVSCEAGYHSSGAFSCGADRKWALVGDVPAECRAMTCRVPPLILHGGGKRICNELPSGMLCEAECWDTWKPVGEFRCDTRLWVDAPVCVEAEFLSSMTSGENRPIVKVGFSAEPSSDIQDSLRYPQHWASAVARAFEVGIEWHLSLQLGHPARVEKLGLVGFELRAGERRLQDVIGSGRPNQWRADVVFAAIPKGETVADAQEVYASLAALSIKQLEVLITEALAPPRPESVDVLLSVPRLAEMPAELVAQLPDLLSQEPGTTTEASSSSTSSPNFPTDSTDNNSSGSSQPTSTTQTGLVPKSMVEDYTLKEKDSDDPSGFVKWVLLGSLPCGLCMAFVLWYKFIKATRRHPSDTDDHDRNDYDYCKEQWVQENVSDGVNLESLEKHQKVLQAQQRLDYLKRAVQNKTLGSARSEQSEKSQGEKSGETKAPGEDLLSHWHIKQAPRPIDSIEKQHSSRRELEEQKASAKLGTHEKQSKVIRFRKYIKRFCYVLLCGRQVARDFEHRQAAREGRKSRLETAEERNSRQTAKKARITEVFKRSVGSQENVQRRLTSIGLPQFLIEKVKARITLEPSDSIGGSQMPGGFVRTLTDLEGLNTTSAAFESDLASLATDEELEFGKQVSWNSMASSQAFAARTSESSNPEAKRMSAASPRPRSSFENKDASSPTPRLSARFAVDKDDDGQPASARSSMPGSARSSMPGSARGKKPPDKYAPAVAEEHENGQKASLQLRNSSRGTPHEGLVVQQLQSMNEEQYEEYSRQAVDAFFEFDMADEIGNPWLNVIDFWDPKTQAALKAKASVSGRTGVPEHTKAGTLEKVYKDSKYNVEQNLTVETVTTKYPVPKRTILTEEYKQANVAAIEAGSMSSPTAQSVTESSGENDLQDEFEGAADKLSSSSGSSSSGSSGSDSSGSSKSTPDVEFGDEDVNQWNDEGDDIAPVGRATTIEVMSGIAQSDAAEGQRGGQKPQQEGSHSTGPKVTIQRPTNPQVLEAIEAARGTRLYNMSDNNERSAQAKAYWGIETREGPQFTNMFDGGMTGIVSEVKSTATWLRTFVGDVFSSHERAM